MPQNNPVNLNLIKRNWSGTYENVAILLAMAVNEDGFREVIGASAGIKEEKTRWQKFLKSQAAGAYRHAAIHRRQMPGTAGSCQ